MINDERKKAATQQLAALIEETLIAEVTLSPKPGLVDALDTGAHSDIDYALFLKSAKTLTPFFEEMAQIAWQRAIGQGLREKTTEIGRRAKKVMLIVTDSINTHKGAIRTVRLSTSMTARRISMERPFSLSRVLDDVSELAALPDTKYRREKNARGHTVEQGYGVNGAYEEVMLGYPRIRLAIQAAKEIDNNSDVQKQMHMLLVLMDSLDDTCVLHRSDQKALVGMRKLTHATNQGALPNHPFVALLHFCREDRISPGGSADLSSISLFVLKIEEIWTTNTYACPMSLND